MADFAPLVQFVESCPNLKLTGLYTFRGLNGGIDDPALAGAREGELLAQYRMKLNTSYIYRVYHYDFKGFYFA